MSPTTTPVRRSFVRRTLIGVGVVALAVLTAGCDEYAPIGGTVTFKTIESPRIEEYCGGFPVVCDAEEISTKYRVEITYPDDTKAFEDRYDYIAGKECWFSVQPDEYAAVNIGDTVKLGNPSNEWTGPDSCELAEDLAPNSFVPEGEFAPGDSEFTPSKEG